MRHCFAVVLIALVGVPSPVVPSRADDPKAANGARGIQAVLVTVDDEQISARITAFEDGTLTLAG